MPAPEAATTVTAAAIFAALVAPVKAVLTAVRRRAEVRERAEAAASLARLLLQQGGEGAAAPEDQRLRVREADVEVRGDLFVGEPAPVAEEHGPPLLLGELRERVLEPDQLVAVALPRRRALEIDGVADELEASPASGRRVPRQADVTRDPEQPGELDGRDDATPEAPDGVEERGLDGVLRVLAATEPGEAVGEDLARVVLVERGRPGRVRFDSERLEAGGATDRADCCQLGSSSPRGEGESLAESIP